MMKKVMLIVSLILLFIFSIPIVKSPFVNLRHKSTIEPKEIAQGGIGIQSARGTCYVPPWTECPDGYVCANVHFGWLRARGKKVGWDCTSILSDPGQYNYKIRIVIDLLLGYWETVTSKALFNGTYVLNVTPTDRISSMSSSLDFNYSHPGPAYVFEPSYLYGENAAYYDCAIMWLNFTQTDNVTIGVPILYKMYITDLNRDNHIDVYDAIIFSNEYGQSWSLPVDSNDDTWRADINSDGIINTLDAVILKNQFGTDYIEPRDEGTLLNIWEPMWENTLECA